MFHPVYHTYIRTYSAVCTCVQCDTVHTVYMHTYVRMYNSNSKLYDIVVRAQVQPHMKKCFDNIKSLDMTKVRERWEGSHMNSSEGEKVELSNLVHLEGAVEVS